MRSFQKSSRIMYIEDKSEGLEGDARIGRVYSSRTGMTLYYRGVIFKRLKGSGFKSNYFDIETGLIVNLEHYIIYSSKTRS
jgi:hypothetical protein